MADNGQTRTARRKQKKSAKKPIWKKLFLTALILILIVGIGVGTLVTYWVATAPEIDETMLKDPYSSVLLDKDGERFAELGANRKKVNFEDLPDVLIDAVTATEDVRFFDHPGIDLRRIGGAVVANIVDGFGSQGASTITQQVVEKSFLTPDKELKLKVQEQWLALKLERKYTKEEILEMYLNKIFYGANSHGVVQAAETYFGKELKDLTLPEAAILAGLPQRPTAYNPFENPDLTKKRMDTVLSLMVRHGKISEDEANEAREVDISSLLVESQPDSAPYGAFIQQVEQEVKQKLDGIDINTDGLVIHTTLDTHAQEYVEFLLTDSEENPISYPNEQMPDLQSAMAVLDTKTGAIQAIGGRKNPQNYGEYNYAIQGGSQIGSTAKPIMAYGPAIEYNKISTYHQLNDDKPYETAGSNPIRNWNRSYAGWVTARYALEQSLNVPTVKLFEEVGAGNAQTFAESLGIRFADDQINIRDAIGGTATNVTPLQLAGAYRAFGNEGIYNEPYAVTKVEFPDGEVVDLTPESEAVMSDYTAYMVTDMLKSVVTSGTGTGANVSGLDVAGKTGTTNLQDEPGSPDAWFAGYTTNFTIAAWTGGYVKEEDDSLKRAALPDTKISQRLFKHAMTKISEGLDTPNFTKPESVVEAKVEKGSNPAAKPSEYTPSSEIVTELFVKGTEPTNVSEKYDQLDPVSNLTATFNEESESIEVSWDYDSDDDVSFVLSSARDGGDMKELSSTQDTTFEITEVEPGDYEIQIVVVSNEDDSNSSEPTTATVTVPELEEESEGNINPVEGLNAEYIANEGYIDVTWNYNGPPALFRVTVDGEQHPNLVEANGIEIGNVTPGQTYAISVTPIGQNGANSGIEGETRSINYTIPADNDEPVSEQEDEDTENTEEEADNNGENEGNQENEDENEDGEEQ
ncbi:penicillin-binding protein 1A [Oceanobacillus halophilus]|uniref:PBP1A family penicillin-binding protein n=1 Tax=Oceanobacillus halophilus TaxID=930130 RepID=A0A495ADN0_9BACI|nr:penicillin-binding protein 1A [Oceanobacillus halophilus]RKQ37634.1 PBP1A family penicillin-binding protein [Oceanobacillus halophilus]